MNLQEKINKLLPYVSENFITYPLWEEGKYIPFINFWQICKENKEFKKLLNKTIAFNNSGHGYIIEVTDENIKSSKPFNLQIYPDFEDTEEGGYEYVKKDWSIEEMLEIITELIEK